jgi:group I intron endonuclease
LTDPRDGIVKYVGQTGDLKIRLQRHMSDYYLKPNGLKENWLRYLKNNGLKPTIEVLDEGTEENIDDLEIYWISQFKTWGFTLKNVSEGGNSIWKKGYKKTDEQKEKYIESNKKRWLAVNKYSIETGELVESFVSVTEAAEKTGLKHISECCKAKRKQCGEYFFRYADNYFPYIEKEDYWTGAKHSVDSIEKMKMNHPFRKVVCQYSKDGKFITEYDSSHEAENKTGISRKQISNCCKKKPNYNSAGGFIWKFKE